MATSTIGQLPLASSVLDEDYVEIELAASGLSKRITRIDLVGASLSGGGIIDTGGFTATIPANGTVAMLGTANVFTQDNAFADQIAVGQSAVTSGIMIDVTPAANVTLRTRGSGATMISMQRSVGSASAGNVYFYKTRGSVGSESAVVASDVLGNFIFGGHDGTNFIDGAFFGGIVDGTVSSGIVPTAIQFYTGNNSGDRAVALTLSSAQLATFSKFFVWAGQKRVSTQFDKTANTTLSTVTGLSVAVIAGATYYFKATLHITADATGGHKVAIAGSGGLTATSIIYQVNSLSNSADAIIIANRLTALGGAGAGHAGSTEVYCEIEGTITVNVAGDLVVQFAQNASNLTSSVLVGSTFIVHRIT